VRRAAESPTGGTGDGAGPRRRQTTAEALQ
jgi:hypothetical protein